MRTTILALLLAVSVSSCSTEDPLPPTMPVDSMPAAVDSVPVPVPAKCDIPAGYTLVLTSCPGTYMSVCIAQDSAFYDAPAGTIKIDLTGCHLDNRPDVVCVAACPAR